MNKFLKSFSFTYFGKISNKSFITITLILMLIVVFIFNTNRIMSVFNQEKEVAIVTENTDVFSFLNENKQEYFKKNTSFKNYNQANAKRDLNKDKVDYILDVKVTQNNKIKGILISKDTISKNEENNIRQILDSLQNKISIKEAKLNTNQLNTLKGKSDLVSKVKNKEDGISQKEKKFQIAFTMLNLTIMVFIIMNYANQIAMEVAVEKTSKVIEMIITSIKPSIHIVAKILGVFSVALTQIFILLITIGICIFIFDIEEVLTKLNFQVTSNSTYTIILNLVFWVLGIISYSLIAAILGSLTSRIEDIGQSLMPLMIILLGSFYIVFFSMNNPNNLFIVITSYIPLISPFTMLFRVANTNVDSISIIISLIISIVFLIFNFFIAIRSYKYSVLIYDKNIIKNIKRMISK